ncbi:D-xylose transporter XylE [Dysgonomonas sp. HDW5A]|uniref:D-xylose transporter XylE n=1 Tax=unclassified Dysgonomonas TaxID=2630389 RepID=UPI00140A6F9C|nr:MULTISPECIES: D-xylose transporter XylE [unclassified Dysgonomonas]QIK54549.1 D-xylose transporter XylE [Dysgonomonas sp. HDW5B]QIK59975.1 D-xylose transporter XylE [Dysgonomonas sp. HDW5A]
MRNEASKSYTIGLTVIATLGGLLFGYDTAVISGTVESLRHFFIDPMGLPTNEANAMEGFVISSALIGCIFGAAIAGWVSQQFGRKTALFAAAILFLFAAIGSAWPEIGYHMPDVQDHTFVYHFVFYRIIGGVGVGIASMVSPMYIAEIAPPEKRGSLVALNQFAIIFGMLVVYFVNYFIAKQGDTEWLHSMGWRWMFASLAIPSGLFFVLLFFAPETPRWLIMKGHKEKGLDILTKLVGATAAKKEMDEIQYSFDKDETTSLKPYYKFMMTWLVLFVVGLLALSLAGVPSALEISMICSFIIALFVPIRSYGFLIIITGVLLSAFQQFVGINVVLYYAPEIFKSMGSGTDSALLQTIIVGIINLSFTVLAIMTVDKFGRKPLLIIGALIMAVSMLGLGTSFSQNLNGTLKLIFMLTYTAGFAMSWGPVCWVMLSEMFPNSVRSSVMSIAVAAQWVSNFLISWTFPIMDKNETLVNTFNHGFAYWVYGALSVLAALFVWKFLPETKGKTLEDMEQLWKK